MRERTFGPTVLVGLAASACAAVAASRDWATASGEAAGVAVSGSVAGSSASPPALALGLVALAAWGTVLVLRGRTRRSVAAVGLLASAGVVAAVGTAFDAAQDAAREAVVANGATGDAFATSVTGWFWVTGVAAVLTAAAFAVAVRRSPAWPEMGSRYDAPSGRTSPAEDGPADDRDLWRSLDEGHDPTV